MLAGTGAGKALGAEDLLNRRYFSRASSPTEERSRAKASFRRRLRHRRVAAPEPLQRRGSEAWTSKAVIMSNVDLRTELEGLRREIAALRAERSDAAKSDEPAVPADAGFTDQLQALASEISALAEEAEKGLVNHPLAGVLGALVLGILIGRIAHR
jgi:hypothetical protein